MFNSNADKENQQILIVDDDEFIVDFLAKALRRLYTIGIASNISDAVKTLEEKNVDVLITDLNLVNESGITLAKIARKYDPNIEIIFITGFASLENARTALDLGIVAYMTKPIDIVELFSVVEKALHIRKFNMKVNNFSKSITKAILELETHVQQIISIHKLLQKMNQAININDTVRLLLSEISNITNSDALIMGINVLGYSDIYGYSAKKRITRDNVITLLTNFWKREMSRSQLSLLQVRDETYPITIFCDKNTENLQPHNDCCTLSGSISIFGEEIGFISTYHDINAEISEDEEALFYTIAPLVAPALYRGYLERKTYYLAQTDGLTGVTNRRAFNDIINKEIIHAIHNKITLSFLMIDIDFFKKINDTYGHLAGDDVLKKMAEIISHIIGKQDNLTRFGGEEFTVILSNTNLNGAIEISENIRESIENCSLEIENKIVKFTVSIGISSFNIGADEVSTVSQRIVTDISETLIRNSDTAMYAAKQNNRNCVYYFDENTNSSIRCPQKQK